MRTQLRLTISLCVCLSLVAAAAGQEVNTLVSPDMFGEMVDLMIPGYVHWSAASGDTADLDGDTNDVCNSFGEHAGTLTRPSYSTYGKGSVAAEAIYAFDDNTVEWEFTVPGPGRYVMAMRLWSELQVKATAIVSYRRGEQWVHMPSPSVINHTGGMSRLACYLIDIPAGQTKVPVRIGAKAGRVVVRRVMLGRVLASDPFVADPKPTHPSMHFHAEDIPTLREKIASGPPKFAYEYMKNRYPEYLREFQNTEKKMWTPVRSNHHVGRALAQTGFLYVLTGEGRYRDTALQMIEKIMSWTVSVDPIDDQLAKNDKRYNVLTRGRNLSMIALVYDWLYDDIPAEQRDRIRRYMATEATRLHLYVETGRRSLGSHNWDPWIAAGPAMVGIALRDEHKWTGQWIDTMSDIFHVNLAKSGEDFGYFVNGFTKAIDYGMCLKTATGEDLFAPNANRLATLLEYRMMLRTPRGGYPAFGDASSGNNPMVALPLATYQRDTLAQWYLQNLSGKNLKQVSGWGWHHMMPVAMVTAYDPSLPATEPALPRLPLARSFANDPMAARGLSAVTILRTGYQNKTDFHMAIRSGPFFGWHSHPDQGSFILSAYDDTFTVDVAMGGTYGTKPNDFSKTPASHTQVLIDGEGQITHSPPVYYDKRAGFTGPLLHTPMVDYVLAEFATAYRKNPKLGVMKRADRHFVLVRKPDSRAYLVMIDDLVKDDQPHQYEWLLQTNHKKTIDLAAPVPPVYHNIIRGKAEMDVFSIEPQSLAFETSEHFDRWRTLHAKAAEKSVRGLFMTVLNPRPAGAASPKVSRLTGDNCIGANVNGEETILFRTGGERMQAGGISSDAKIVVVGREDGKITWLLCVDGTEVTVDGEVLLKTDKPTTTAIEVKDE